MQGDWKRVSKKDFYNWTGEGPVMLKKYNNKNKLRGLSPQANYNDRATAACRQS
jgi:hypothetical protein